MVLAWCGCILSRGTCGAAWVLCCPPTPAVLLPQPAQCFWSPSMCLACSARGWQDPGFPLRPGAAPAVQVAWPGGHPPCSSWWVSLPFPCVFFLFLAAPAHSSAWGYSLPAEHLLHSKGRSMQWRNQHCPARVSSERGRALLPCAFLPSLAWAVPVVFFIFLKPVVASLPENCQSECLGQGRKIFPCLTLRRRQNKDHVLTCMAMGTMERWQGASAGGCSACPRSDGTLVSEDSPPAVTPAMSSHCVSNTAGSELLFSFFPPFPGFLMLSCLSQVFTSCLRLFLCRERFVGVVWHLFAVQWVSCLERSAVGAGAELIFTGRQACFVLHVGFSLQKSHLRYLFSSIIEAVLRGMAASRKAGKRES